MSNYIPELGQAVFGQPSQAYACGNYIEAALMMIRDELDRVMGNITQKSYNSPFNNSGERFECDVFKVHAYSWGDEPQPWNFTWKDVEISWYKWLGRGMSINRTLLPDECAIMLDECLSALCQHEKQNSKFYAD